MHSPGGIRKIRSNASHQKQEFLWFILNQFIQRSKKSIFLELWAKQGVALTRSVWCPYLGTRWAVRKRALAEHDATPATAGTLLVSARRWVFNRQPAVAATHSYCLTTYFKIVKCCGRPQWALGWHFWKICVCENIHGYCRSAPCRSVEETKLKCWKGAGDPVHFSYRGSVTGMGSAWSRVGGWRDAHVLCEVRPPERVGLWSPETPFPQAWGDRSGSGAIVLSWPPVRKMERPLGTLGSWTTLDTFPLYVG